jgi:hypothetical protein
MYNLLVTDRPEGHSLLRYRLTVAGQSVGIPRTLYVRELGAVPYR